MRFLRNMNIFQHRYGSFSPQKDYLHLAPLLSKTEIAYKEASKLSVNVSAENLAIPRALPVPQLNQTLEKFLRTVKPLVSDDEFKKTAEIVKGFGASGGIGEKLQALLKERALHKENWLSDWWLETAYLKFRLPVIVYSSPGVVGPFQPLSGLDEQLRFAARFIAGALRYKQKIDNQLIPLESLGGHPLDMSQYYKVLGTCRIPGTSKDSIVYHQNSRHIVVARNGHLFKVPFFGNDGSMLSEWQLYEQLLDVASKSGIPARAPVGILTSEHRDTWGKAYQDLAQGNASVLKEIHSSSFIVCLDNPTPEKKGLNRQSVTAAQMLFGSRSEINGGNRWFDKTLQFVIGSNGEVGLTYEHSPAEGPPIANMLDQALDYVQGKCGATTVFPSMAVVPPQRLDFNLSEEVEKAIAFAKHNLNTLADDIEMSCFTFKHYGRDFIKSLKLSPDSFIQMAIQLAFYRLHNVPCGTYESASLRQFKHGRTETIRSCSVESVAFTKGMVDKSLAAQRKASLLKAAIESHKNFVTEAINGAGVDRHLLGLRLVAAENGIATPDLYSDPGYVKSSHMRLSTSQVPFKSDSFMCYGPLVPDGYGCCYNPRVNDMSFAVSAHNSDPETSATKFRDALEQSFLDMHDVLLHSQTSKL